MRTATHDRMRRTLADRHPEAWDFLVGGGWSVATIKAGGGRSGGITSHRGVLHPDEYVDSDVLTDLVTEHLGFTPAEVRSVYRAGRMTGPQKELRARIDARFLEVAEAGGNMVELGRALGMSIVQGNCRTIGRALARARRAREDELDAAA